MLHSEICRDPLPHKLTFTSRRRTYAVNNRSCSFGDINANGSDNLPQHYKKRSREAEGSDIFPSASFFLKLVLNHNI